MNKFHNKWKCVCFFVVILLSKKNEDERPIFHALMACVVGDSEEFVILKNLFSVKFFF